MICGERHGKVWGHTVKLVDTPFCEVHRLVANKGGVCSKHLHKHKYNTFYIEQGRMLIRVWKNDYDLCDETILEKGQQITVPPGELHQFEALEDETICFEIYFPFPIGPKDIERETVGYREGG